MGQENVQFRKNFIWNVLGTGLNAFNSLFFMIIVTRVNGIDQAGIFTIAFSTACIIYFVGVYAGRIYQVTELNQNITDKEFIVNRMISSIAMLILVILFSILRGYNLFKSAMFFILTFYKALEAFSDVLYGILQKHDKLEIVGKSFFMKAIISIILFLMIDLITKNMILASITIIIVNIAVLILYDTKKTVELINLKEKTQKENIVKIFKSGFFTFAISFLGVYILNAPKYAIDSFLEENYQTIFGIIVMPATVIGLVAQFLIHPYLNQIVDLYKKKDLKNFKKLILKLVCMIAGFGAVASLLAYLLGPEVLGIIYGIDLTTYRISLLIIIISATLYTIGIIYSSVLTAVRETFSQFIIYIVISLFALISSNILTHNNGMSGSVIAYFGIMTMQFGIYAIYTNIKFKKIFNKEEKE